MYEGWMQVAFDTDLCDEVVPVDVAGRPLVAVRSGPHAGVYDATCPHRGAHLGYGGKVDGAVVVCPFHGHRVHLGLDENGLFRVRRYHSVHAAKGLFVLLDPARDTGLGGFLDALQRSHHIMEGFTLRVAVPPEFVIENVFDADHFAVVHSLDRRPRLEVRSAPGDVLCVEGIFDMVRPNKWQTGASPNAATRTRFSARVFSPTLVASELGPASEPNVIITAATPTADGACMVRVTVALPRHRAAGPPTVREVASLVSGSRTAFEQDAVVWEHLDPSVVPQYTEGDQLVRTYRDYCRRFLPGPPPAER